MTISLSLLAQPHSAALRSIVSQALIPGVDIDNLIIGQEVIRHDGDVSLPVYIDSDAYNDPTWLYRGSVEMRYKRLDLGEALGHLPLRVHVGPTYRSSTVVARISQVLQLHFLASDYIAEEFPLTTSTMVVPLRASPDSKRYKGQVDVLVYR